MLVKARQGISIRALAQWSTYSEKSTGGIGDSSNRKPHPLKGVFEAVISQSQADQSMSKAESNEQGHGQTETRRRWSVAAPKWLTSYDQWKDLKSLVLIESRRTFKDQTTTKRSYFILRLSVGILFRASRLKRHEQWQPCASTWALKTHCIGFWISHFKKTPPTSRSKTRRRI
jgi:hypothetical protein